MVIAHISNTRHVMSVMYDTVATNICSLISKLLKGFISDNNYHATHLMQVETISYTTMNKLWDSTKETWWRNWDVIEIQILTVILRAAHIM